MTIRISSIMAKLRMDFDSHGGSVSRRGVNRRSAAEQLCALRNAGKTEPAQRARLRRIRREALPVVPHGQGEQFFGAADSNRGFGSLGVLEDIVDALLDDAVKVDLRLFGKHIVYFIDLYREGGLGSRRSGLDHRPQRRR